MMTTMMMMMMMEMTEVEEEYDADDSIGAMMIVSRKRNRHRTKERIEGREWR